MKVLLMTGMLFGYEKLIIKEIENLGYEVDFFNYELDNKYKKARKIRNPLLNLYNNLYLRKVKKINLKDLREAKAVNDDLLKLNKHYDIFLKIGPIFLQENTIKILKKLATKLISHHWDSIDNSVEKEFFLEKRYFDKISIFDKNNAMNYKINYLPNFYVEKFEKSNEIKYDLYTIMRDISRKDLLEKIKIFCNNNDINANLTIVTERHKPIESNIIKIQKEGIPLEKMMENFKKSKCILELVRVRNNAPSLRTMDCIGLKKKLITNNKNIIDEDFYNSNNILIIDENNINISRDFIDSPYEELPKEIYEKYSLKNWTKELFKNI